MLVYGDIETVQTVKEKQAAVAALLESVRAMPPGIARHGALVTLFIEASELVQGVVDAGFHDRGFDTLTLDQEAGMACLMRLAQEVDRSWQSGFASAPPPTEALSGLRAFDPDQIIRTRQAEGYAFYALYPESYLEAARCSGLGPDTQVIGIRSIGTGLSALVAATLGAPAPFTLRPVGHPFGREVRVDPALTHRLTSGKSGAFAVVDEGPGLSGSSFGAVADWLEEAGIPRERIHFFPSHGGPLGPKASDRHRERWRCAPRHLVPFEDLLLGPSGSERLAAWTESLLGPLEAPLEELSGGAWRALAYADEAQWPPANIQQERRKFLARAGGAAWLVRFAGLSESGVRKLAMARKFHEAGFAPEAPALCHGFLVERWHDACRLDRAPVDRGHLVEHVGAYLGFRARHFPAGEQQGASLQALRHMAIYNTGQALGDEAAAALTASLKDAEALEAKVRRVWTDNRMHAWEWLVLDGHLLKTDALDHSAAHDLVGCQDIAWDVAGAIVELNLSEEETSRLCELVQQHSGYPVHLDLLRFLLPCYLAFQMGACHMAAGALGEGNEAMRLRRAAERYRDLLRRPGIRQEQEEAPAG